MEQPQRITITLVHLWKRKQAEKGKTIAVLVVIVYSGNLCYGIATIGRPALAVKMELYPRTMSASELFHRCF